MSIAANTKILVVEDDNFLQGLLSKKLSGEGFEIAAVNNGNDALEKVKEFNPNAILLDLILPEMQGFEVLEKLKDDPNTKEIPVIVLSNLGQKEEINKGMELGAADYMVKAHFTPEEIVEKVEEILNA